MGPPTESQAGAHPRTIRRISVRKLFGMYDYDLAPVSSVAPSDENLLILYGENGCGKTTILKLVYHMLSPEPNEGHRTYVGGVPFRSLEIELTDGFVVRAERPEKLVGRFKAVILYQGKALQSYAFRDERIAESPDVLIEKEYLSRYRSRVLKQRELIFDLSYSSKDEGQHMKFCEGLAKLAVPFHFLGDERRLAQPKRHKSSNSESEDGDQSEAPVEQAIQRAEYWIRRQTLKAFDSGAQTSNDIYTQVIERISELGDQSNHDPAAVSCGGLIDRVNELYERNAGFAKYGLTAPLAVERLVKSIRTAHAGTLHTVERVLAPYFDGLSARLDELSPIEHLLTTFVGRLNEFLHHKAVEYDLKRGFRVLTGAGEVLGPQQLSSGENELLLMLCSILGSRDKATVFLIDEPEISLNVKWQRMLISAMLDCLRGTNSQIVIASHSIELVAQYRGAVCRLGAPDDSRN